MGRPKKVVAPAPEVVETFTPTAEEIEAIKAIRQRKASPTSSEGNVAIGDLAAALVQAIETTRPPTKKNPFNRKKGNPWLNKDGSPKPKLKRTWHQHGGEMNPDNLYSDEINLLNQVKPGVF